MAALALVAVARSRRVQVEGMSMYPGLLPGDRLVVVRTGRLRPGQIVALEDPRNGRLIVKRVHRVEEGAVDVRGDNDDASTDSRHFGTVPRERIRGRVVYRYAPPERSGRLP